MWTRVIGKAQGTASMTVSVDGVTLYQHIAPSGQQSPTEKVDRSRTSSNVGESFADKRSDSFANLRLLASGGRRKKQHQEKLILAELQGQSSIMASARFGRWTLLGENTIQVDTEIAELDCQLDRMLRFTQPRRSREQPLNDPVNTGIRVKEPSPAFLVSTPIAIWDSRDRE
jgi:hypothetical protein